MIRRCGTRTLLGLVAVVAMILALGTGLASASGEAIVRSSGPRTRPVVALTFDDGTSPANCRRILAELVARGVPATFFPMGAAMPLDPAFWRLVAEVGDPVGDHTLTHPEMPRLTLAQQEWQIGQGRVVAEAILGRPLLRVFRPPYGAYDSATLVAAAATGFPIALLWDVDTRDWARTHTLAQMLAAGERGGAGSVILMHCGPNATPYLVPQLIDYYRSKGFGFVTIPQLLGLSWQPAPTQPISPATILDGLSPLPPLPSSVPITSPSGSGPTPDPSPSATPRASETAPAPDPATQSPLPSVGEAPTDASGFSPLSTNPPSATTGRLGPDAAVTVAPVFVAAILLGGVLIVLSLALIRRRRPR